MLTPTKHEPNQFEAETYTLSHTWCRDTVPSGDFAANLDQPSRDAWVSKKRSRLSTRVLDLRSNSATDGLSQPRQGRQRL